MSSIRVVAEPASSLRVRATLREELADLDETALENVALVTTELLSNAIRHARALEGGVLIVTWEVGASDVRVCVTDGGSTASPQKGVPAPSHTSGRGLMIVDHFAQEWGVSAYDETRTSVWAVVSTIPVHTATGLDAQYSD